MKRTTVFLEECMDKDLGALARRQSRPRSELIREALGDYLDRQRPDDLSLGFLAVGRSGRSDVAQTHEDLLFDDLQPHGD